MKKYKRVQTVFLAAVVALALLLSACGKQGTGGDSGNSRTASAEKSQSSEDTGLKILSTEEPEYAAGFSIVHYENGYSEIDVTDGREYFVVPEGASVPEDLPNEKIVIKKPLQKVYVASSSSMSRFVDTESVDRVAFSGIREDEWKIPEAARAMADGSMTYTGKYSAPDYETLLTGGCDLAVENLMILHKPEVIEKLEALGIAVFIDRASAESEPLGRTEWIKAYGILLGKEEDAENAFDEQKKLYTEALPDTGRTVVYFYINSQGLVVCPRPDSSVAKMIAAAGGIYLYPDIRTDENRLSTMKVDMESYMAAASGADIIIYDGAIDTVNGLSDIVAKNAQLSDFKAIRENKVYISASDAYQNSDDTGTTVHDLTLTINGQDGAEHITKAE